MLRRSAARGAIQIALLLSAGSGAAQAVTLSGPGGEIESVTTTAPLANLTGGSVNPLAVIDGVSSGAAGSFVEWVGLPETFVFELERDYDITDFHLFNSVNFGAQNFTLRFYNRLNAQVDSFTGAAAAGTNGISAPNDFTFAAVPAVRRIELDITSGLSGTETAINEVTFEGSALPIDYLEFDGLVNLGPVIQRAPHLCGTHWSGFGLGAILPPGGPCNGYLPQSPDPSFDFGSFLDDGTTVGESTVAIEARYALSGAKPDLAIEFVGDRVDLSQLDKSGGGPHDPAEVDFAVTFNVKNRTVNRAFSFDVDLSFMVESAALTALGASDSVVVESCTVPGDDAFGPLGLFPDPTNCSLGLGQGAGVHHGSLLLSGSAALPASFTTNALRVTIFPGDSWSHTTSFSMQVKNGAGPTDLSLTNLSFRVSPATPVPTMGGGFAGPMLLFVALAGGAFVALRARERERLVH